MTSAEPASVRPESETNAAIERAYRDAYGSVLATLIRFLGGDFDAAEEALADAFATALETWPRDGIPTVPAAWLTTAGRNRALDRIRRDRRQAEKLVLLERELAATEVATMQLGTEGGLADDRLRLIFTCCHPALPLDARVALTLRTLGGLTTPEIARAFLVPEATLAQRLVRAKRKIREAGIPYRVPLGPELPERLDGVLATLYLVFNEGYLASAGEGAVRHDLCAEAIRLAAIVADLLPDRPETHGLLALLLLQDSRREARVGADGSIALLEEQDRTRWDRAEIARGLEALDRGFAAAARLSHASVGRYLLQAAIAAEHARTLDERPTDWRAIATLYQALSRIDPSPIVELNRAVAIAQADGPAAGLALLDELTAGGELTAYHLLPAARADLLRRLGRLQEAAAEYQRALALSDNDAERRFLRRRLAETAG
ncbi:MAG TPA: sigma-70 family RNA polymerase sigma factor [Candidatus Limnocylindrales bacterium]